MNGSPILANGTFIFLYCSLFTLFQDKNGLDGMMELTMQYTATTYTHLSELVSTRGYIKHTKPHTTHDACIRPTDRVRRCALFHSLGSLYTALHKTRIMAQLHENETTEQQLHGTAQHSITAWQRSERNTTRSNTVFPFLLLSSHFLFFPSFFLL